MIKCNNPTCPLVTQTIAQKLKWQPPGGLWLITAIGAVIGAPDRDNTYYDPRLAKRRRATKQQAEVAARELRTVEILMAYRDEFCPDHRFTPNSDNNCVVVYDHSTEQWVTVSYGILLEVPTAIYMDRETAQELCRKLNNGEIEI